MSGKTGAPACVGIRSETLGCCRLAQVGGVAGRQHGVGDRAQRHAVEEQGRRCRESPGRDADEGDQANPARGETLFVSVLIVLEELQVVAEAQVQRQAGRSLHSSCA